MRASSPGPRVRDLGREVGHYESRRLARTAVVERPRSDDLKAPSQPRLQPNDLGRGLAGGVGRYGSEGFVFANRHPPQGHLAIDLGGADQ